MTHKDYRAQLARHVVVQGDKWQQIHLSLLAHDQSQRQEIARLREALTVLMEEKIDYMRLNNLGNAELTHSVALARQALAKEATHDKAE